MVIQAGLRIARPCGGSATGATSDGAVVATVAAVAAVAAVTDDG